MNVSSQYGVPVFEAEPGIVMGAVVDRGGGSPLPGATVSIAGGAYLTRTDSSGLFRLPVPLWGLYRIGLSHPRLDSLRTWPLEETFVELQPGKTVSVEITTPSVADVRLRLCGNGRATSVCRNPKMEYSVRSLSRGVRISQ